MLAMVCVLNSVFGECQIVINGLAVEREVENMRGRSLREFWGAPPHFQIFASSLT
jgi:hypothetical protein